MQWLLSEDGKNLSAEKLAREKSDANTEWRKRRREAAKEPAGGSGALSLLETSRFEFVRNQTYNGREVIVLRIKPTAPDPNARKDSQKLWSKFEGEFWVDATQKMIIRLDVRLTEGFSTGGLSGLFSSLRPGSTLLIESSPFAESLWVIKRLEFRSTRKSLGKTVHFRQVDEFSDYQLFDKNADHLP